MTDISVYTQPLQVENLSWDKTRPHLGARRQGVLAVAAFTQAQHFANGYLPSGTILAKGTSGTYNGLLVPYLGAGSAGAATPVGVLDATVAFVQLNGALKSKVGCGYYVAFADIDPTKLPFTSSNAAAGGYLDAAAITALKNINFVAA